MTRLKLDETKVVTVVPGVTGLVVIVGLKNDRAACQGRSARPRRRQPGRSAGACRDYSPLLGDGNGGAPAATSARIGS